MTLLVGWLAGQFAGEVFGSSLARLKKAVLGEELEGPMAKAIRGAVEEVAQHVVVHEGIDRDDLRESLISRLESPLELEPEPKSKTFTEIVRSGFAAQILPPAGRPPAPESWSELYGLDPVDVVDRLTEATCIRLRGLDAASLSGISDELRQDDVIRAIDLTRGELLAELRTVLGPAAPVMSAREIATLRLGPDNLPIGGVAAVGEVIDAYDIARLDGQLVDVRIDDQFLMDVDQKIDRLTIEAHAGLDKAKADEADGCRQVAKEHRVSRRAFDAAVRLLFAAPHDGLFTLDGTSFLSIGHHPGQTAARAEAVVEAASLTWAFARNVDYVPWYLFQKSDLGSKRWIRLRLPADSVADVRSLPLSGPWSRFDWDRWAYPLTWLASWRPRWFQIAVVPALALGLGERQIGGGDDLCALTALESWLFAANPPSNHLEGIAP